MFSYTLVYLVEQSFGFISGVSLVELSNINKPLLKELSEKARALSNTRCRYPTSRWQQLQS